jgi:hypothetical protein
VANNEGTFGERRALGRTAEHAPHYALPARQDRDPPGASRHPVRPEEAARAVDAAAGQGEAAGVMDWSSPRRPTLRPAAFVEPCSKSRVKDKNPESPAMQRLEETSGLEV